MLEIVDTHGARQGADLPGHELHRRELGEVGGPKDNRPPVGWRIDEHVVVGRRSGALDRLGGPRVRGEEPERCVPHRIGVLRMEGGRRYELTHTQGH
ncbi:hypothetical protein [Phytohabitans rumicis]|uniref:hypothetical protein n=1 Tax=Phytohabitans rumicis TaxID=1076125 RepID=UPI00156793BD|nr:hypothetical protein [Phytohabitans rumicis]